MSFLSFAHPMFRLTITASEYDMGLADLACIPPILTLSPPPFPLPLAIVRGLIIVALREESKRARARGFRGDGSEMMGFRLAREVAISLGSTCVHV